MSTLIDCDEGFVTSIGCDQSILEIKESTIDSIQNAKEENTEKVNQNNCKQCHALESKINTLSDENSKLKELNKEMFEMDRRRQKCDHERQDYIQRLLKTIKKLQLRSSRLITSDSHVDFVALTDRQRAIHMSSDQSKSDDKQQSEKSLLQQSYENALKENVNLQKELEELRNNFDTLIEQLSKIESEHIQVLEFQAKLHKEDYEIEKKDKENALIEVKLLNSENDRLNKICTKYENKIEKLANLLKYSQSSQSSKKDVKHNSSQTKIATINGENFKTNSLPNAYKYKANKWVESEKSVPDCNLSIDKSKIEYIKDIIECPNCQILFPVQYQEVFLQHFEKCQGIN